MSEAPVLDITTIAPTRPTIRIKTKENPDGRLYELAVFDDLSIHDQQFLYSRGAKLEKLIEAKQELDQDQKGELELIVDGMLKLIVLDLPDEVLAQLGGGNKIKIIEAFTTASPEIAERVKAIQEAKAKSTGAS